MGLLSSSMFRDLALKRICPCATCLESLPGFVIIQEMGLLLYSVCNKHTFEWVS